MHSVFSQEIGFPSRVIVDRGSEFTVVDTRALMEEMEVKMEKAHWTVWSTLRVIRVMKSVDTWKAALPEVTYPIQHLHPSTNWFFPTPTTLCL